MSTIFTTAHGSRLYGFWHAGSDYDSYTVTDQRGTGLRQSVNGDSDRVVVGIDRFLGLAAGGSHQSCEALFSPVKQWSSGYGAVAWRRLIESHVVYGAEVFAKYERTIRKFCYGDFKRRRHAVRLASNLADLRKWGRFNPQATLDQALDWSQLAQESEGDKLAEILEVAK